MHTQKYFDEIKIVLHSQHKNETTGFKYQLVVAYKLVSGIVMALPCNNIISLDKNVGAFCCPHPLKGSKAHQILKLNF
jgi:hypothetical protein